MDTERSTDQTEDPRRQEIGQGGYPETNPADTVPGEGAGDDEQRGGGDTGPAPSTSTPEEADREKSTGNPGAAG